MRLSEAIRLGAMLRPQGFGLLFNGDGGSCALGAALESVGYTAAEFQHHGKSAEKIYEAFFPWWEQENHHNPTPCPACTVRSVSPRRIVAHLNDHHRWTRERIADWVQTVEPAQVSSDANGRMTRVCD